MRAARCGMPPSPAPHSPSPQQWWRRTCFRAEELKKYDDGSSVQNYQVYENGPRHHRFFWRAVSRFHSRYCGELMGLPWTRKR